MNNPQLTSAYRKMKPQFKIHPPHGVVIADAVIYSPSDYSEPIKALAEAYEEAIYITQRLCRRISDFPKKTAESLFAYIIGHEFYHFLEAQGALTEKQEEMAIKHSKTSRKLHSNKLEQTADSFGIIVARQAGYNPELTTIADLLKTA